MSSPPYIKFALLGNTHCRNDYINSDDILLLVEPLIQSNYTPCERRRQINEKCGPIKERKSEVMTLQVKNCLN